MMLGPISRTSTVFIWVPVARQIGGVSTDPTADAVNTAFLGRDIDPTPADWHPGTWDTVNGTYYAKVLIGPKNGGVSLAPAVWEVWQQVVDNPEIPQGIVCQLRIV